MITVCTPIKPNSEHLFCSIILGNVFLSIESILFNVCFITAYLYINKTTNWLQNNFALFTSMIVVHACVLTDIKQKQHKISLSRNGSILGPTSILATRQPVIVTGIRKLRQADESLFACLTRQYVCYPSWRCTVNSTLWDACSTSKMTI